MNEIYLMQDPVITISKPGNRLTDADKEQLLANRNEAWRFQQKNFYLVDVNAETGPAADLEAMQQALQTSSPRLPIERDIHFLQDEKQFKRNLSFIMGATALVGMPLICKTVFDQAKSSPETPGLNHTFEGGIIGATLLVLALERKLVKSFFKIKKELTEKKTAAPEIKTGLQQIVEWRQEMYAQERETNDIYAPV